LRTARPRVADDQPPFFAGRRSPCRADADEPDRPRAGRRELEPGPATRRKPVRAHLRPSGTRGRSGRGEGRFVHGRPRDRVRAVSRASAHGTRSFQMKSSSRNQSRAVFAVFAAFAASVLLAEGALAQGTTVRVSVDANGAEGDDDSGAFDAPHLGNQGMEISGDGQCIAFASRATNLIPGDTNGVADVFVKVLATGAIERVSVDSSGNEANGP